MNDKLRVILLAEEIWLRGDSSPFICDCIADASEVIMPYGLRDTILNEICEWIKKRIEGAFSVIEFLIIQAGNNVPGICFPEGADYFFDDDHMVLEMRKQIFRELKEFFGDE